MPTKKKYSVRRRWIEAGLLALGAAVGVVQAVPAGTSWQRVVCAMLAAGLPVLVFQLRHGGETVPAVSP
jgi:hypothetical protein